MYKNCQTEQSSRRQRELEMGLLQMLQKHHYEDISVSDLCAYLQIPRKAFYRYFSNKDGALYALLDHTLAAFLDASFFTSDTSTQAGDLKLFFSFWYDNRALLDALQHSGLTSLLVERANAFALQEGYLARRYRSVSAEVQILALAFTVCGLMAMVVRWHLTGFQLSSEEMSQIAITLLKKPLLDKP